MTDAEIGEKIGASQSIVSRLRNGIHKTTFFQRAEAIRKLALENSISIEELANHPSPDSKHIRKLDRRRISERRGDKASQ